MFYKLFLKSCSNCVRLYCWCIVMSGFLFGLGYILGPKEGVDESTAQTAIPVISLGFGIVVYYIINHQNTRSKEIIQKIESRY